MKILMITMSPVESLTSAMLRNLAVVKGLVDSGHAVTLISPEMSAGGTPVSLSRYPFLERVRLIRLGKSALREKIWTDPRKKSLKARLVNVLRRVYHAFSVLGSTKGMAKGISLEILGEEREFDLLLTSSDPKTAHLAGATLLRQGLKASRWVQYWGDPLTLDMTRKSLCPTFLVRRLEKKLLRGADRIVYVSPFTLTEQKRLFPHLQDRMDFAPVPYIEERREPAPANERFRVSYVGAYHSAVRNILPFYEALVALSPEVEGYLVGDTDLSLSPTDSIHVLPRGDAREIEASSDLLVCVLNRFGTQIPGKIYHAAATSRPILVITDGECAEQMCEYLRGYDRFLLCPNEKGAIEGEIRSLMEQPRSFTPSPAFSPVGVAEKLIKR